MLFLNTVRFYKSSGGLNIFVLVAVKRDECKKAYSKVNGTNSKEGRFGNEW